jgi:hypothetical protein
MDPSRQLPSPTQDELQKVVVFPFYRAQKQGYWATLTSCESLRKGWNLPYAVDMQRPIRISMTAFSLAFCLGVLSACGGSSERSASNRACAIVEDYLDAKALILMEAKRGESALEAAVFLLGNRENLAGYPSAEKIFDAHLSAMKIWAQAVDRYQENQISDELEKASFNLERSIDTLIPLCEDTGWSFESGWR